MFFDADGDGVLDSGEAGLSGWTVNLFDSQGDLVDSALTASDGTYAFSGVDYGSYKVAEVLQPGYVQTAPATITHSVTVSAGGTVIDLDFGNDFLGAVIKGQKFHDLNANRIKDPGEDGLNGWQIQLLDENGELVASTMTADYDLNNDDFIDVTTERGWYFFEEVVPATYILVEVPRSGWIQSTPALSSANTFTIHHRRRLLADPFRRQGLRADRHDHRRERHAEHLARNAGATEDLPAQPHRDAGQSGRRRRRRHGEFY